MVTEADWHFYCGDCVLNLSGSYDAVRLVEGEHQKCERCGISAAFIVYGGYFKGDV